MSAELGGIVATFEREVTSHLARLGQDCTSSAIRTTIATNSTLIAQRGDPLVQLLCDELGRPGLAGIKVLDLGCGYGALSVLLATEGAFVLGIDADPERLEVGNRIAAAHGLSVDLRPGRIERPGVTHASFDVVMANNSFCYVVDPEARARALEEAFRALRPGGTILLRDPNRLHPRDQFTHRWLIGVLPPRAASAASVVLGRRRSSVRLRSPRSACRELECAGFVRSRIRSPGGHLRRALAGYNIVTAHRPLA